MYYGGAFYIDTINDQLIILHTDTLLPVNTGVDPLNPVESIGRVVVNIDRFTGSFSMSTPHNPLVARFEGQCWSAQKQF